MCAQAAARCTGTEAPPGRAFAKAAAGRASPNAPVQGRHQDALLQLRHRGCASFDAPCPGRSHQCSCSATGTSPCMNKAPRGAPLARLYHSEIFVDSATLSLTSHHMLAAYTAAVGTGDAEDGGTPAYGPCSGLCAPAARCDDPTYPRHHNRPRAHATDDGGARQHHPSCWL